MLKKIMFGLLCMFISLSIAQENQHYLSFDGNDYVKYFNDSYLQMLDGATDYTLEAWIFPDTSIEKYDRVFQRYYSFNIVIWHVSADTDSCDWYFTAYDNNGNSHYFNAKQSIAIGAWNHIAVINNSEEGTLRLYVDGQDVTTENYANFTLRDAVSNDNFYVGQKGNGTDFFTGYIDEVRLKNIAINPSELNSNIQNNYSSDANTSLLLHFDEGEGYHWTWNAASENDSARLGGTDLGDNAEPTWMVWEPSDLQNKISITPGQFYLKPNYPNPFNPITYLPVFLPANGTVYLQIFNNVGQKVKEEKLFLKAGKNKITVDAGTWPSGSYFYRVQFKKQADHGKMLLIK